MPSPILLDTCATIWLMNGDPMSPASRKAITAAQSANLGIHISPISAWEIATLVAKNRLQLAQTPESWFDSLLALPGVRLAPMAPNILISSATLPGTPPNDPADRIIAATARSLAFTLITRDGLLIPYGKAGHIQIIPC